MRVSRCTSKCALKCGILQPACLANAPAPAQRGTARVSMLHPSRQLATLSASSSSSSSSSSSKSSSSFPDVQWDDMHGLELGGKQKKMTKEERTAVITLNISAHAKKMDHYRKDTQTLANWLDLSVVKIKGRLYPPDYHVLPTTNIQCIPFPVNTQVTTLNKEDMTIDEMVPGWEGGHDGAEVDRGLRLVTFSFKAWGYTLVDSWLKPFTESQLCTRVPALNICFVEYGFLSFAKGSFIGSLQSKVEKERWAHTAFAFGGVMDFATQLLLPNKFSGYAYLVDGAGRVRWRACGMATEAEAERMLACAKGLLKEQDYNRSRRSAELKQGQ